MDNGVNSNGIQWRSLCRDGCTGDRPGAGAGGEPGEVPVFWDRSGRDGLGSRWLGRFDVGVLDNGNGPSSSGASQWGPSSGNHFAVMVGLLAVPERTGWRLGSRSSALWTTATASSGDHFAVMVRWRYFGTGADGCRLGSHWLGPSTSVGDHSAVVARGICRVREVRWHFWRSRSGRGGGWGQRQRPCHPVEAIQWRPLCRDGASAGCGR
ncbi:hypothetical protein QBC39DRAFT_365530 [Podospora conica]|nr:hypothetical protein QBC39DRAFT_365530 [Schizothecium conicum]